MNDEIRQTPMYAVRAAHDMFFAATRAMHRVCEEARLREGPGSIEEINLAFLRVLARFASNLHPSVLRSIADDAEKKSASEEAQANGAQS